MQILLYLVGKSHMDYPVKEMFPLFIFLNLFESLHIFQNTFFFLCLLSDAIVTASTRQHWLFQNYRAFRTPTSALK